MSQHSLSTGTATVALKEWAVTVRALQLGRQIILLRKGGIREEGKTFHVPYSSFLLLPTYEHQSADQLKENALPHLETVLSEERAPEAIKFSHWAQLVDSIELNQKEEVAALFPYHIWSQDYAEKRLRWKPRTPLTLLVLRVYQMDSPVTVPYLKRYGGCKSWVELQEPVALGKLLPVVPDFEFREMLDNTHRCLQRVRCSQ